MKESEQNGIAPMMLVLIVVGILAIAGAGFLWSENRGPLFGSQNASTTTGTTTNSEIGSPAGSFVNSGEDTPVINSISPSSGAVGTNVVITGKYLNGFEGDSLVWLTDKSGKKGVLTVRSLAPEGAESVSFKIPEKICTKNTGESGLPCPSYINILPGDYKLVLDAWGHTSNQMILKVASSEGKFCGGIGGIGCGFGYSCKLDGNYPDAGGVCVKN